jgi:hypothetical protein
MHSSLIVISYGFMHSRGCELMIGTSRLNPKDDLH